jgi:hypothetical protein
MRLIVLYLFFISLSGILACTVKKKMTHEGEYSDIPPIGSSKGACHQELLICMSALSTRANKLIAKNKVGNVRLINMGFVDVNNMAIVDEQRLKSQILALFPTKTEKKFGMFDWEGLALESLVNLPESSPEYKRVFGEFIKAYRIAKKLRPNVKFGFYGLPFAAYWTRDKNWRSTNFKLVPLFREFDVIFPCIYDFYLDSNPFAGKALDSLYVSENVELALELASLVKKPLYPVINHRWQSSDEKCFQCLIPLDEFISHANSALAANFKGTKVNGLVWWGEDRYFYGAKDKMLVKEVDSRRNDFETYEFEIMEQYLRAIDKALEVDCAKNDDIKSK